MEEASSPDSSQQDSEPVQYAKSTWKAFAALATEHLHALRHILDNKPDVENSGEVHQQHETVSGLTDSAQTLRSPEALPQTHLSHTLLRAADAAPLDEAVRIEMDCVKAKVTGRNPDKDVVVRLEIMQGVASRVCSLTLRGPNQFTAGPVTFCHLQATAMAIVAAVVVGAIILVAELIKKLQLVSKQHTYLTTTTACMQVYVAVLLINNIHQIKAH